jgi:hypothetical protein
MDEITEMLLEYIEVRQNEKMGKTERKKYGSRRRRTS